MMNNDDAEEFLNHIDGIALYFKYKMTEFLKKLYWESLRKYDISDVKQAIINYISNSSKGVFMPKIAEIIKEIEKNQEPEIPETVLAMQAWSEVLKLISSKGSYETPIFEEKIINRVISDMGGWKMLCSCTNENMVWKQKDFETRYISYLKHPAIFEKKYLLLSNGPAPLRLPLGNERSELTKTIANQVFKKIDVANLEN